MIYAFLITLILGLALMIRGLRGRRIDDHPLCRKCGFDLTGKPAGSTRCPECGADLNRRRPIVVGHRQRKTILLAFGVALITMAAVALGVLEGSRATHFNWLRYATTNYLIRMASSADVSRRTPALTELTARFGNGKLDATAWSQTADAGLTYQGDLSKPWDPAWGTLLEGARSAGRLSDKRWLRYETQAIAGVYRSAMLRPRVRRGDPLPCYIFVQSGRVASHSLLNASVHDLRVEWDGPLQSDTQFIYPKQLDDPYTTALSCQWRVDQLPWKLAVENHSVHVAGKIWIGFPRGYRDVTPDVILPLDLPSAMRLLPATEPSVTLVADPSLANSIRNSLKIRTPVQFGVNSYGTAMLDANGNRVALSFSIILRTADGHEYHAGKVTIPAHSANYSIGLGGWPTWMTGQTADVVLKTDVNAAAETVDITRVWDGVLVFKGVR